MMMMIWCNYSGHDHGGDVAMVTVEMVVVLVIVMSLSL